MIVIGERIRLVWLLSVLALCGSLPAIDAGTAMIAAADGQTTVGSEGWTGSFPDRGASALVRAVLWSTPPADRDDEDEDVDDEEEPRRAPELKKLTPQQINRIRYMELRAMRLRTSVPDRVSVKIPRETIDEFLVEMEGDPRFQGKRSRQAFLKKTAPQKLHIIAQYKGAAFADRVEIRSDPEVFIEFRRNVMPIVLRSCASNGCHSQTNEDALGFRLFKDPKKTAATTYANFVVLNDLVVGNERVVNRAQPQDSLLLTYMLPRSEVKVERRHPGDVEYRPTFQSRKTSRFKRIEKWIGSLRPQFKHDENDYGVHLIPRRGQAEDRDEDPSAPSD